VANPDFLYQEAYFRLELMDGSYKEIAKKYLGTQSDWSSDKNMKFIFDFVNNPDSKSFRYLIENREKFERLFGKEQVQITVQILIYNKLYQGVPRPSLDESINLFKLINEQSATEMAYEYYLSRIYDECKEEDYQKIAKKYLHEINPHNVDVIYNLAEIISHQPNTSKEELSYAIRMMEKNLENRKNHPEFFKLIAILSFKNDNKKQALKYIDDAIKLAKQKGLNLSSYLQLKQQYI
jgi:tetratricopeptide (TPR) repeat protein